MREREWAESRIDMRSESSSLNSRSLILMSSTSFYTKTRHKNTGLVHIVVRVMRIRYGLEEQRDALPDSIVPERGFAQVWGRIDWPASAISDVGTSFTQLSYFYLLGNCTSPDLGNLGIMILITLSEPANESHMEVFLFHRTILAIIRNDLSSAVST